MLFEKKCFIAFVATIKVCFVLVPTEDNTSESWKTNRLPTENTKTNNMAQHLFTLASLEWFAREISPRKPILGANRKTIKYLSPTDGSVYFMYVYLNLFPSRFQPRLHPRVGLRMMSPLIHHMLFIPLSHKHQTPPHFPFVQSPHFQRKTENLH